MAIAMNGWSQTSETLNFDQWKTATIENPYDITSLLQNPSGTQNFGWMRNPNDTAAGYNKLNTEFASAIYSGVEIESWYWQPVKNAELVWQEVNGVFARYL